MSVPLLGHAIRVCALGWPPPALRGRRALVGVRWRWAKLDLAWEFGSPVHVGAVLRRQPAFLHSCGGAAAAAGWGKAVHEKANGF
jgi:hypothetical protein